MQTAVTRSAAAINISYGLPGDSTMLTGTLAADLDHRGVAITASDAAQLAEARDIAPVAAVQNAYHVQAADDALLAECTQTGIAFVPFVPLGGGFDPIDTARFEKTAARHGATVQQVALAALLAASPVMLPIPGTGSLAHLEENVGAASVRLTPEDLAELGGQRAWPMRSPWRCRLTWQ